jgi:hypothetical protein
MHTYRHRAVPSLSASRRSPGGSRSPSVSSIHARASLAAFGVYLSIRNFFMSWSSEETDAMVNEVYSVCLCGYIVSAQGELLLRWTLWRFLRLVKLSLLVGCLCFHRCQYHRGIAVVEFYVWTLRFVRVGMFLTLRGSKRHVMSSNEFIEQSTAFCRTMLSTPCLPAYRQPRSYGGDGRVCDYRCGRNGSLVRQTSFSSDHGLTCKHRIRSWREHLLGVQRPDQHWQTPADS